jgi:hypothetical protein
MRITCLHPRFGSFTSHHYNESAGLQREFARRGLPFRLLMSRHADPEIVAELGAEAAFDDPTFRLEWSFEERSARMLAQLHAHLDGTLDADDCVMITVSTQLEAHALVAWMRTQPPGRLAWVVVVFISDRWNRSTRQEYDRQVAEFALLRAALAAQTPEQARKLLFFTLTAGLAEELGGLLGRSPTVVPMPLEYRATRAEAWSPALGRPPRLALLGGNRREKGSHRLPGILAACEARGLELEYLVQVFNNSLDAGEATELAQAVQGKSHMHVIDVAMPMEQYHQALDSADLALFPYEVVPYRQRTSGVFGEAVAYGKPVLATAGTWMAQQIEAGRAAGAVFAEPTPAAVSAVVAMCLDELPALQARARALASAWREDNGIPGFVQLLLDEVSARQDSSR